MTETCAPEIVLLAWLSPSFPVGSFAFSHGLEWAVETGDVKDGVSLEMWLVDLLNYGAIKSDGVFLASARREPARAVELNELALALCFTTERRLETTAQGSAFLSAVAAAWPTADLTEQAKAFDGQEIAYPVALGLAAAAHEIPILATLEAFLIAAVSNLVSAVMRLGPIGQSEAQAIIARLAPHAATLARWALHATIEDSGTCAWRSDIASMLHETQYSRLFRS